MRYVHPSCLIWICASVMFKDHLLILFFNKFKMKYQMKKWKKICKNETNINWKNEKLKKIHLFGFFWMISNFTSCKKNVSLLKKVIDFNQNRKSVVAVSKPNLYSRILINWTKLNRFLIARSPKYSSDSIILRELDSNFYLAPVQQFLHLQHFKLKCILLIHPVRWNFNCSIMVP